MHTWLTVLGMLLSGTPFAALGISSLEFKLSNHQRGACVTLFFLMAWFGGVIIALDCMQEDPHGDLAMTLWGVSCFIGIGIGSVIALFIVFTRTGRTYVCLTDNSTPA